MPTLAQKKRKKARRRQRKAQRIAADPAKKQKMLDEPVVNKENESLCNSKPSETSEVIKTTSTTATVTVKISAMCKAEEAQNVLASNNNVLGTQEEAKTIKNDKVDNSLEEKDLEGIDRLLDGDIQDVDVSSQQPSISEEEKGDAKKISTATADIADKLESASPKPIFGEKDSLPCPKNFAVAEAVDSLKTNVVAPVPAHASAEPSPRTMQEFQDDGEQSSLFVEEKEEIGAAPFDAKVTKSNAIVDDVPSALCCVIA
eukprot:jgi/Bigna1/131803/aug1.15_g6511